MDAKQAIEIVREMAREAAAFDPYLSDFILAVETLAKALEWQPMETAPLHKEIMLRGTKGHAVFGKIMETISYKPWRYVEPSCNGDDFVGDEYGHQVTFCASDFTGWKEVE